MITRIQIDGFKTFTGFDMEFSPLTVIAGANASGKSNLFDALQLLSDLAEVDHLRKAFGKQRGEARELFTQYTDDDYADQMAFGVELLINRKVRDNFGGEAELKYTRLRYELRIKRVPNDRGFEDLIVEHESLEPLRHGEDRWVEHYLPKSTLEQWRPKVVTGKRGVPYIHTTDREKGPGRIIAVLQDGKGGNRREFPLNNITQTVLSGINSVDFPHALAAKEELRSWKFLQLNPQVLREPTPQGPGISDTITQQGHNLAAALHRINLSDPRALRDISRRLNNLLPNLTEVLVLDDKANKQFLIKVRSEDGREFSSRVLSEGTLRLLALCVFQFDEQHTGLLCFEEPENGIHPARLREMAQLLTELSIDFESSDDQLLRQVVVNTHSPVLVSAAFDLALQQLTKVPHLTVYFSQPVTLTVTQQGLRTKRVVTRMLPVEADRHLDPKTRNFVLALPGTGPERQMALQELIRYLDSDDAEKTRIRQVLGVEPHEAISLVP